MPWSPPCGGFVMISVGGTGRPQRCSTLKRSNLISEHLIAVDAFAAIDRMVEQMEHTGAPTVAIELVVIDSVGKRVTRPDAN